MTLSDTHRDTSAPGDSAVAPKSATFEEGVAERTMGTHIRASRTTVQVTTKGKLNWDPPHEQEAVPEGRLSQILKRITQAIVFYESKMGRANRPLR